MFKFVRKIFWWLLLRGWLPDFILRRRIRNGVRDLSESIKQEAKDYEKRGTIIDEMVQELKERPIAIHQQEANEQHYEVPSEFYRIVLGPKLKYSSCLYPEGCTSLSEAEENMLNLYIQRSEMVDGMSLLDLGCGWGSVALHFAGKFKNSRVFALSNSRTQKQFIDGQARERGLTNLTVFTGDVAVFDDPQFKEAFDRVISIEMFEHMKNYEMLLGKISAWLKDEGKLFVHIFTHKWKPYDFKTDWMARTFFTGGIMPSHALLLNFQRDLLIERTWGVSGVHYQKTLEAWLKRMDDNKATVMPIVKATYGDKWQRWWLNWRLFFLVCAETFGMDNGSEWGVSHYLFKKK